MRVIPPPDELAAVEATVTETHVQLRSCFRPADPPVVFRRGDAWREFTDYAVKGVEGENRVSPDLDVSRQPDRGVLVTTRFANLLCSEYEWEIFVRDVRKGVYVSGLYEREPGGE